MPRDRSGHRQVLTCLVRGEEAKEQAQRGAEEQARRKAAEEQARQEAQAALRARLIAHFERWDQAKIPQVDALITRFAGKEAELEATMAAQAKRGEVREQQLGTAARGVLRSQERRYRGIGCRRARVHPHPRASVCACLP